MRRSNLSENVLAARAEALVGHGITIATARRIAREQLLIETEQRVALQDARTRTKAENADVLRRRFDGVDVEIVRCFQEDMRYRTRPRSEPTGKPKRATTRSLFDWRFET